MLSSLNDRMLPHGLINHVMGIKVRSQFVLKSIRTHFGQFVLIFGQCVLTLSNVDAGETGPTPVTTVLSRQNLMDANKFLVLFNVI